MSRKARRLTATREQWTRAIDYARDVKWPDVAYTIEYGLTYTDDTDDAITIPFYSKWGEQVARHGIEIGGYQ